MSNTDRDQETEALIGGARTYASINNSYSACPTCKGSGKIAREQEHQLIALIPLSDKRLKPKRIWVWILATISICILVTTILSYTLAPRDVLIKNKNLAYLQPLNITEIKDDYNSTIGLIINYNDEFYVQNQNFYMIKLENIKYQINRNSHLDEPKILYELGLHLSSREDTKVRINVEYAIYIKYDPYANLCLARLVQDLFSLISVTFTYSTLWSSNSQVRIDSTQYIVCTMPK